MDLKNRRPDDERYRHYEFAGASHVAVPPPADAAKPPAAIKLPPAPGQPHFSAADCQAGFPAGSLPNDYPLYLVQAAMFSNMYEWLDLGRAPPPSAFIETNDDGSTLLDERGNAQGGVRLPQVSVPIAKYAVGVERRLSAVWLHGAICAVHSACAVRGQSGVSGAGADRH